MGVALIREDLAANASRTFGMAGWFAAREQARQMIFHDAAKLSQCAPWQGAKIGISARLVPLNTHLLASPRALSRSIRICQALG